MESEIKTPENVRLLIYSQDGFGLGHLRRNLNITHQIKNLNPDASVLIIVDSPVAPFFELPPKCDFVKIPTMVKVDYGIWRSNRLKMDSHELLPVRSQIIQHVALDFKPHYFLVDHMPQGALGELTEPIRMLKKYSPNTKAILGLRDILGSPKDISKQWKREKAFDLAEKFYDTVLIYGSKQVYDSLIEYEFPASVVKKAKYCGYVCREDFLEEFNKRDLEDYFPQNGERLILVTGGGGYDAGYFMDAFLDTVRLLKRKLKFKAIVSVGPFLNPEITRLLEKKSQNLPVDVVDLGDDVIHFLKRADLVISMAGYNTVGEILRFRKNAIIIPRPGPSAEQTMRSGIFSQLGLFSTIHPKELTIEKFSKMMVEKLSNGHHILEQNLPDLNGSLNAAKYILNGNLTA